MGARLINLFVGVWLMISPDVFNWTIQQANHQYLVGPLIIAIAIIALSEATRNVRYGNTALGVWLIVSPWVLSTPNSGFIVHQITAGLVLVGFSLRKGNLKNHFGGGWRSLLQKAPRHSQAADELPIKSNIQN